MPLCLKVCKLGFGSIEAPSRGEPKPGPLGPDFYSSTYDAVDMALLQGSTLSGQSFQYTLKYRV